jgi:parallel beta-helix repeat protein
MRIRALYLVAVLTAVPLATASTACPTADDIALANAISTAAASGGGTVDLAAGVLNICQPIVLATNVHLRGAGRGATIVRTAPKLTGPFSGIGAAIVGVAVANVSVSDLTLDQRTNNRVGNGIAFVPAGLDFSGTVPHSILVERTQVLGSPVVGGHQYMIWNMRGQHVKILDNWVDGGFLSPPPVFTPQEGIESYGGYDVMIAGNTVEGIGRACLQFGSAGLPNTRTVGIFVRDNYAARCTIGVNIGTANTGDPQINVHSIVTGNIINYAWLVGIHVWVMPGTTEHDLHIADNTIRNVGPATTPFTAEGMFLFAGAGASTVATIIKDNRIHGVRGVGFGIRLWNYPNARILDNSIVNVAREGIAVEESNDTEIRGNRIEAVGLRGIYAGSTDAHGQVIKDNVIINWGTQSDGIRLEGARHGVVQNNVLRRTDGARPSPIVVGAGSCGVVVAGNVAAYSETFANESSPACP